MIRGINKRIIEINDTGNAMFEKALLFVKPENEYDERTLEREAKRVVEEFFVNNVGDNKLGYLRYRAQKQKKIRTFSIIFIAVGVILCSILLLIVNI